jgi:hypothetical protein
MCEHFLRDIFACPARVSIIRIFIRIFFSENYSLLAECSATLRVFMKKYKKNQKKKSIFFYLFFWGGGRGAIYFPQPIFGMPAKIWFTSLGVKGIRTQGHGSVYFS